MSQPNDEPGVSFRPNGADPEPETDDPRMDATHDPTAGDLLRQWRAAERDLAEVEPDTPAWDRLQHEIELLRASYQAAFNSLSSSDPTGSSA